VALRRILVSSSGTHSVRISTYISWIVVDNPQTWLATRLTEILFNHHDHDDDSHRAFQAFGSFDRRYADGGWSWGLTACLAELLEIILVEGVGLYT
jgi:hypothetical protein